MNAQNVNTIHDIKNAVDEIVIKNGSQRILHTSTYLKYGLHISLAFIIFDLAGLILLYLKYTILGLIITIISNIFIWLYLSYAYKNAEKDIMANNKGKSHRTLSHEASLRYLKKTWLLPANNSIENIQIIDSMIKLCDYNIVIRKINFINQAVVISILTPLWGLIFSFTTKHFSLIVWVVVILSGMILSLFINHALNNFNENTINKDCKRYEALKGELLYLKIMFLHSPKEKNKRKSSTI